ncbi:MAG: deoxynucleoside kinase, partial [Gammaproteobacteria bacterium]|nr:deoxynucleoside kinase [Gammaproteobacteria bacterium]
MSEAGSRLNLSKKWPAFVVVEGPIGVGKTTLARRLSRSFESDLMLEGDCENPFIERFYENPRA